MKVIALTGNFGTGKSTVAILFQKQGVPCLDSDTIAHQLTEPESEAWKEIINTWGEGILLKNSTIDRRKLANIVFENDVERKKLESILHPRIMSEIQKQAEEHRKKKTPLLLMDIPLFFEIGWNQNELFDGVIVVSSSPKAQMSRLSAKGIWNKNEIEKRLKVQMPLKQKESQSDFVIDNSGDLKNTEKQVLQILAKLRNN